MGGANENAIVFQDQMEGKGMRMRVRGDRYWVQELLSLGRLPRLCIESIPQD